MTTSAFGLSMGAVDSKFYIGDDGTTNLIREFSMSNTSDITTASATGVNLDFSSETSGIISIKKTPNNNLYIMSNAIPSVIYQYGEIEHSPKEFGGALTGVDNPTYFVISKPWDRDTNERKRIKNIRIVHYPDTRSTTETSNLGLDWVDTDVLTTGGLTLSSFTSTRNVDVSKSTARIYRCGKTRQRIFKVVLDGTKYQIIKGLELDYDLLRG
jgi:hypothetical protein